MTDKQDALDFIEAIYERELRDFGSHSIHDPTHEQRLKYILSFQKHIETIRQALNGDCGGGDLLDACKSAKSFIEFMPKAIGRGAASPLYMKLCAAIEAAEALTADNAKRGE